MWLVAITPFIIEIYQSCDFTNRSLYKHKSITWKISLVASALLGYVLAVLLPGLVKDVISPARTLWIQSN